MPYKPSKLHAARLTGGNAALKNLLRRTLTESEGSIPVAATSLDVGRKTVYRYLEEFPDLLELAQRLRAEQVLKRSA